MTELAIKSKITLSDFNPKQIAGQPDDTKRMTLGTLIGRANAVVQRQSADKETTFTGLGGLFEAYFVDRVDKDGVFTPVTPWTSSMLFAPDWFVNPMLEQLSDTRDQNDKILTQGADAINFAFDIIVQRANNPAGYEWALQPLNERPEAEKATDKLNTMRQLLGKSGVASVQRLAPPKPVAQIEQQPQHEPDNSEAATDDNTAKAATGKGRR